MDEISDSPLAQYKLLGKTGLRVSPLCLGTMNFGTNWTWMGQTTKEEAEKTFELYISKGGNFIDTANVYQDGQSEEWLGEWIAKRGIRDDLVIATKYSLPMKSGVVNSGGNHRKNMFQSLEASLKRLQTTYIDVFYVHFWDFTTSVEEIMRSLDDLVRSGKVHYIAISDAPAWQVSRANTLAQLRGWSQFVAYQGRYHLGERDQEREIIPMSNELGIALVPWGVLGSGKYTGKYKKGETYTDGRKGVTLSEKDYQISDEVVKIAEEIKRSPTEVTLNWAIQKPNSFPLLGVRSVSQLTGCLSALDFKLTEGQLSRLDAISSIDLGFPHNFIGTSYQTCPWLEKAGTIV